MERIDPNSEEELNVATQAAYDYVRECREDKGSGKVIIYGYSWARVLANHLAKRLKNQGIAVNYLIIVDAANGDRSDEVDRDYSNIVLIRSTIITLRIGLILLALMEIKLRQERTLIIR